MASYADFLGRKVTVHYRVGDILLPATGTFVGDSGRSIFLEQHLEQRGRVNYFRWEIPYQHIHRIARTELLDPAPPEEDRAAPDADSPGFEEENSVAPAELSNAAAAGGSSVFRPRPKTA